MILDYFCIFEKVLCYVGGLCFKRRQYLCQLFDIRPSQSNPASGVEIEGISENVREKQWSTSIA
jgi:hypothetical protein